MVLLLSLVGIKFRSLLSSNNWEVVHVAFFLKIITFSTPPEKTGSWEPLIYLVSPMVKHFRGYVMSPVDFIGFCVEVFTQETWNKLIVPFNVVL